MGRIFGVILVLVCLAGQVCAIEIGVFDSGPKNDHEKKVMQVLRQCLKSCPQCHLHSLPIYDNVGNLYEEQFIRQLKVGDKYDILHFSWNMLSDVKTQVIERELNGRAQNKIIVAAAGETQQGDKMGLPLSKTVMGKVKNVLLIGELNDKRVLKLSSFYGKQLFTALPSVKNLKGSSFTSAQFTCYLALELNRQKLSNLTKQLVITILEQLRQKKQLSGQSYPKLDELFPLDNEETH